MLSAPIISIKLISQLSDSHGDNTEVCPYDPKFKLDHRTCDSVLAASNRALLFSPIASPSKALEAGTVVATINMWKALKTSFFVTLFRFPGPFFPPYFFFKNSLIYLATYIDDI